MPRIVRNAAIKADKPRREKKDKKQVTWLALSRSVINISISSALRKTFTVRTKTVTRFMAQQLKHSAHKLTKKKRGGGCDEQKNDAKENKVRCAAIIGRKLHLEAAVSIKLLSKFHLNPLIVNSITQTACMRACVHACISACACFLWVGVHM